MKPLIPTQRRFLIVDDDERFALLVAKRLENTAQCVVVLSGEDALLQFEYHLREKAPFSVVFMDIGMPEMDGHAVVERMREIERRQDVSPVNSFKLIMLTSHKDISNVSKAFFHNDADAYIHKAEINTKLHEELRNLDLI
ncbi:response regulator [Pseudodesulfovibrio cashew]|uniref:Response regulator n=1 Tax=Pseudodesulfovibrio cashew TaxID=2678688 RepID=A0A6I6JGM3_9BACT|nr:response regulator [Pseudodesulfovibrio cashew]QGY41321.1 response regulator [Pseudodesulfovibrio cashew]